MPEMPVVPRWDALQVMSMDVQVDRKNNVLRGYVVAQKGEFKSSRGQFNDQSLQKIVTLMAQKPQGTKSRFAHPGMSSDGIGSFLGRSKNPRLDGDKVRADLYLDPSSFNTPQGNLGGYVLDLAESDPDALSSSLVLKSEKVQILDEKGRPRTDETGEEIPAVWLPTRIHASDLVDTGDAVDGLLSAGVDVDGLPMAALWRGKEMLDSLFAGQTRDAVSSRLHAFVDRYLSARYGEGVVEEARADLDLLRRRQRLAERRAGG